MEVFSVFDELKQQIRMEIGNKDVTDINSDVAITLRKKGDKALEEKNFEKYIACYEIIAEDIDEYEKRTGVIPKEKSSAAFAYLQVLTRCVDCGYAYLPQVLKLAEECRENVDEMYGPDSIFPPVDGALIDSMCAVDAIGYYTKIEKYAKLDFNIGLQNYKNNPSQPFAEDGMRCGANALVKIYIYLGKYREAYDILTKIPSLESYPELITFMCLLEAYKIFGYSSKNEIIYILENWADAGSPEANWALGIMYADGYFFERDAETAKRYFDIADECVEKLKGQAGRTGFDFKVFSNTPQSGIIRLAKSESYQSKFYKQMLKNSNSKPVTAKTSNEIPSFTNSTTNSTSTSSSEGCYIATCVYGSYDCPPVWTLRRYRDNTLYKKFFGRLLIKIYYATSPTIVKLFGKNKWFSKLLKKPLDKLVENLNNEGIDNTPYNDK